MGSSLRQNESVVYLAHEEVHDVDDILAHGVGQHLGG